MHAPDERRSRNPLSRRWASPAALPATALTILLASCGSGGGSPVGPNSGGGGGGGNGPANTGQFTIEEFAYTDPLAATYHPFGDDVFFVDREELVVFTDTHAVDQSGLVFDDSDSTFTDLGAVPGTWPTDTDVFDSEGGQLDGDRAEEVVAVGVFPNPAVPSSNDIRVRVFGQDASGTLIESSFFDVGVRAQNASLQLADVDDDGIDEILIACATRDATGRWGASLRIFDDATAGHLPLLSLTNVPYSHSVGEADGRVATGNFDSDEARELVFVERLGDSVVRGRVLDDASTGFAELHRWTNEAASSGPRSFAPFENYDGTTFLHNYSDFDVATGNFDDDDADEILICGVDLYSGQQWRFAMYDDLLASNPLQLVEEPAEEGFRHVRVEPLKPYRSWQLLTADLDGNGIESLVLSVGASDGGNPARQQAFLHHWAFGADKQSWRSEGFTNQIAIGLDNYATCRSVVIRDSIERRDRIHLTILDHDYPNSTLRVHRIGRTEVRTGTPPNVESRWDLAIEDTFERPQLSSGGWPVRMPITAAADLDADGLGVRFTGRKELSLADPMPICVMAAPPTKDGISQNHVNTQVAYGTSSSASTSHVISANTTVSGEVGLDFLFFADFFSADVRATYESSIEDAHGTARQVTKTVTYVGGHENDHIVFQGVLYQSYVYEIVVARDPQLVGTELSIDVPVSSRIYKWTLDYYNDTVEPPHRIDRGQLLGHRIGAPETYPTRMDAESRTANGHGWKSLPQSVGQGRRVNTASVEITETNSSSSTRTVQTGLRGELKIGPFIGGASLGSGRSEVYSVETSVGTEFEGSVGDIAEPADYVDWQYDFGLVLYHVGGGQTAERGFQVLHFWTDTIGAGY